MDPGAQTGKQSSTIVDTTTQAASQRLCLLHAKYIHANLHCTFPSPPHPPIPLHPPLPSLPNSSLPWHYLISVFHKKRKTTKHASKGGEVRGGEEGGGGRGRRQRGEIPKGSSEDTKCPTTLKLFTCTGQLVYCIQDH